LNYFEHIKPNGFTPGLLTPKGTDKRLKHIKPFLAQGAYFASIFLSDFSWLKLHYTALKKSVAYRHYKYYDKKTGLACWYDSMESGADNNVAALGFPNGSIIAADLNAFLYREYKALAAISKKLGYTSDAKRFLALAEKIKQAMNKFLWDEHDNIFYNVSRMTRLPIKRVTYSSYIPLWAGVPSQKQGKDFVKRYLTNQKKLWARHGIRTLSRDDKSYNQKNIIKPYSNWQGPVWPIVNYLAMHALLNYGFKKEAQVLAVKISQLCLVDIQKTGGMHEDYNAETGKPLAAPDFISWNLLVGQMISQVKNGYNPFDL
jgi:alpha,alpha-trehalase